MKYSIVATVAIVLISSANSTPVAPQEVYAPARRLYPYPLGYPPSYIPGIKKRECTSVADCEGDHYCITENEEFSDKPRAEVIAQQEEAGSNEKRSPQMKLPDSMTSDYLSDISPKTSLPRRAPLMTTAFF